MEQPYFIADLYTADSLLCVLGRGEIKVVLEFMVVAKANLASFKTGIARPKLI